MLTSIADTGGFTWDLVADVQRLLQYHFMQNAYLAGTLVAIISGIAGYFMVLRSLSFAGHSLANVGFAGATGAALFGVSPMAGLFVAGGLAAVGIHTLNRGARQRRHSDIAIGAILTAALALGYLFTRLAKAEDAASIYDVLFGNVLGINDAAVRVTLWTGAALVLALLLIGRPLLFASLDPEVAAARGVPVRALGLLFMALLAVTVSEATLAVGALLVFALLLLPAAVAHQLTTRPSAALAGAAGLAVLLTWIGSIIGFYTGYPGSVCISLLAFASYVAVVGGRQAARWRDRARRVLAR